MFHKHQSSFKCCCEAFFGDRLQTHIHISHCAYMPMQVTLNFVTFRVFSQDIACSYTLRVPTIYVLEQN